MYLTRSSDSDNCQARRPYDLLRCSGSIKFCTILPLCNASLPPNPSFASLGCFQAPSIQSHHSPQPLGSEFLVFQLALQLFGLSNLSDRFVEVVLVDRIAVVLDGKEAALIAS